MRGKNLIIIMGMLAVVVALGGFLVGCSHETTGAAADRQEENSWQEADNHQEQVVWQEDTASGMKLRFLNVGEADAALVECEGHYMLVDGGRKENSEQLYTVLEEAGIRHLDIVIGSHAHEDHIGGLPGALHFASAGIILCPVTEYNSEAFRDFRNVAEAFGGIVVPKAGESFLLGSAKVEILGLNVPGEENDTSLMVKVSFGQTAVLFTGDAEAAAETAVLEEAETLKAQVLKVAHHGSGSSTSQEFLQAVDPQYAVISSGTGNEYGHPDKGVLERLEAAGAMILRTDLQGEVTLISDGSRFYAETEKEAAKEELLVPGSISLSSEEREAPEYYLVNIRSGKFHNPDCEGAAEMAPKNRQVFEGTREEALSAGYSPCGWCRP